MLLFGILLPQSRQYRQYCRCCRQASRTPRGRRQISADVSVLTVHTDVIRRAVMDEGGLPNRQENALRHNVCLGNMERMHLCRLRLIFSAQIVLDALCKEVPYPLLRLVPSVL